MEIETSDIVYGVSVSLDGSYIVASGCGYQSNVYLFNKEGSLLWNHLSNIAKSAIEAAKSAIQSEKTKGFNSADAESLLSQAEQSFSTGDYSNAEWKAKRAKYLAIDISLA
jgi:hypothetical protein